MAAMVTSRAVVRVGDGRRHDTTSGVVVLERIGKMLDSLDSRP
jgi:hypothetical protein